MTRILCIRHAEYDAIDHTLTGHTPGLALSEQGIQQAQNLAAELANISLSAIYSSPIKRAQMTATIIAEPHELPVHPFEPFTELDPGRWTGRSFADLDDDPRWKTWNAVRSLSTTPDGEAIVDVLARVVHGLRWLVEQHPEDLIALVSHYEPIRLAVIYCLGMPLDHYLRLHLNPASLTILQLSPHYPPQLLCLNATTPLLASIR